MKAAIEYRNRDWLEKEYIENNKSPHDIGQQCNVSGETIRYWLKKLQIKLKSMAESLRGNKNPSWKGGIAREGHGYLKESNKDHPGADEDGYVLQHRLIAEKIIGRKLKRGEIVHHINGNRKDNGPENLRVMNNIEHLMMHRREKRVLLESLPDVKEK